MKPSKAGLFLVLFLGGLLGSSSLALAEEGSGAYMGGAMRKLGRGIANVATCLGEIPRTASIVGRNNGILAEYTTGVAQGLWRTVQRAGTGVFEVVTFFVEVPAGFEPLMKPEYVWADSSWQE